MSGTTFLFFIHPKDKMIYVCFTDEETQTDTTATKTEV